MTYSRLVPIIPSPCRYYVPEPDLRRAVEVALAQDEQLRAHVVGDGVTETLFSVMREVQKADRWPALRPRIEHATGLVPDLFADALELGVVAVLTSVYCNLARSLAEAGIPLAIGPDSPGNPFFQIMVIAIRPSNLDEALSREQAVTAYTRGSAYAEKKEHVKGTLKPGMLADLAVLSQDISAVAPQALPETTSLLTVVDGEIVHSAGVFDI